MSIKKVSLLLVVAILSMFNIHSASASERFVDVPSSHYAFEEINYLIDLGAIKGYKEKDGTYYKPNNPVTRGQAAKMVIVSKDYDPLIVTISSFSDVKVQTELSSYVERAIKLGIFSEYSKGKFAPNTPLTREEMAKVLSKAFNLDVDQYANLSLPFTDLSPSHPYYKYIAAIYYNGITKGSESKYHPKDSVTRSQFASFIARASEEKFRLDLPVQGVTVPDEKDAIAKVASTTNNLNVRISADSSTSSNILGKVNKGATFPVFEIQSDGWLKVSYNGRYAYIYNEYAHFLDENGNLANSVKNEVLAKDSTVKVYQTRDLNAKVLGSYSNGENIKVYSTVGNWYFTIIDGQPGYVRVAQTKAVASEEPVDVPVEVPVEEPVEEPAETPDNGSGQQFTTDTIGRALVSQLHIREKASGSSKSLGVLSTGDVVEVHAITGNWAQITYKGIEGYTHKSYLKLINQTGKPVAGRVIVIDPGHGGKDPGTSKNGAVEKKIVLEVATKVRKKLEADGAKVYMTRTGDTYPTLQDRVKDALDQNAEIFVSIHVNSASSTSASGTETFYSITGNVSDKEDYALASAINSQIVKNANMVDRKVKREDFYVIRNLALPAVLVELGFVTNPSDLAKLTSDKYLEIYADSIYKGIVEYYTE